jgi:phosphatidate cytidylyltransferase
MSNILQRLLLFFVGVPLVSSVIVFLPQYHHAAAVLLILVFLCGCSLELARFFGAKGLSDRIAPFIALGAGVSAAAYAGGMLGELLGRSTFLAGASLSIILAVGACLILSFAGAAFVEAEAIPDVMPRVTALGFATVYPGLLGAFLVLIASEPPKATESLVAFCILAFSNDSLAWLVGMTLGRRRGIVAVSPNKSVAGFIGGMCGSIGTSIAMAAILPGTMGSSWLEAAAFGLVIGAAVIVGDLFESALKRSSGIKDSGTAVPGRGGFLDSLDSLIFAAPAFYGLSLLLGYFR